MALKSLWSKFFQLSFLFFCSLIGSFFICSFSSILSALLLIFSTILTVMVMYWNLINSMPLYMFSLAMLGGLFVLIGFVIMADENDLNMVISEEKMKEYFFCFLVITLSFKFNSILDKNDSSFFSDCNFIGFSSAKTNDWTSWGLNSGIFLFLILILFIFLFLLHSIMKGSTSGSGFVSN